MRKKGDFFEKLFDFCVKYKMAASERGTVCCFFYRTECTCNIGRRYMEEFKKRMRLKQYV